MRREAGWKLIQGQAIDAAFCSKRAVWTLNGNPHLDWLVTRTGFKLHLRRGYKPVSKPSISDMTFWQLRDELNDLEQRLSLAAGCRCNAFKRITGPTP